MNRINLPIQKIGEKTSFMGTMTPPKFIGLFVLMMSSLLVGAYAEERYAFLRFPNVDPKSQLSAVDASLPTDTSPAVITPNNNLKISGASTSRGETSGIENAPLIAVDNTASQKRIADLRVLITERADAVAQLNLELELIKNRSVALIMEFDQNCGNWKDECATPFAKELETNNSHYSQLVAKLTSFNQELTKAESERNSLTQ